MRRADDASDDLGKDDAHRAFHGAVVALAGNRQLDLALEPILLRLQRPMAANLRREAAALGTAAGIERHERLLLALETNDRYRILGELEGHGGRQFLDPSMLRRRSHPCRAEGVPESRALRAEALSCPPATSIRPR